MRTTGLLLLILLSAIVAGADTAAPAGSLVVQVVDESGQPVAGAEVLAGRVEDEEPRRERTSAAGEARFSELQAGLQWWVLVRREGLAASTRAQEVRSGSVRHLRVPLRRGRTLTGLVTDEEGRPVPGVEVEVSHNTLSVGWLAPAFVEEAVHARVRTGSGGRFHARDTPIGAFRLRLRRRGFVPIDLQDRALPPGRKPFRLGRLVLRRGTTLTGRITDPDGRPLAGVAVWNSYADPEEPFGDSPAALTGPDGTFAIPGFMPRQWADIHFCAAGFLPDRVQIQQVFPDPIGVTLQPAAFLSGRVSSPEGGPIPGAQVHASRAGEEPSCIVEASPCAPEPPVTSAEGSFALGPLQPGWYTVSARAPGFLSVVVERVRLAASEPPPDLDLVLERGTVLMGRVLAPDGTPLAGVEVYALGRSAAQAVTGPDGAYRLDGVDFGRLQVMAQLEGYEPAQRETETGCGENRLDIELAPREDRTREVRGRVVDAAGRPIEGALLVGGPEPFQTGPDGSWMLRLEIGSHRPLHVSREGYAATTAQVTVPDGPLDDVEIRLEKGIAVAGRITGLTEDDLTRVEVWTRGLGTGGTGLLDGRGGYRIPDLAPGDWIVRAQVDNRSASSRVLLEPGQDKDAVDLAFRPVHEVRGWVTGPDGEPVAGADVTAGLHSARSRADGSFSLRLEDGAYSLSAAKSGYLLGQADGLVTVDGGPVDGVEIRLGRGAVLTGRLLGLEPGEVPFVHASGPRALGGEVDLDGRYRLTDLEPGSWEVTATLPLDGHPSLVDLVASGRVQVPPDTRKAVLDLDFALGELTLSGRVLDGPNTPLRVELLRDGRVLASTVPPLGSGTFRIPSLRPGFYRLRVSMLDGSVLSEQDVVLTADQEVVVELGEKARQSRRIGKTLR